MGCPTFDFFCKGAHAITSGVANDILTALSQEAIKMENWAIVSALSVFLNVTPPNVNGGPVQLLEQDTAWFAGFAAVLGLLVAAIRLALERRASAAKFAVRGMLNIAFTSGASLAVITLGEAASNSYSRWIIGQAVGSGNGKAQIHNLKNAANIINKLTLHHPGTVNPVFSVPINATIPVFVIIIFAILGFAGATLQIFLQLARNAILGLLAALLPISAGASTTELGLAWFRKHITWVFAYLLYGPVAATIFAYAYMNLTSSDPINELTGVTLFVLSAVALPALMRLVNPLVTQAVTGAGGGGGFVAGTLIATRAAGLAVRAPTGAIAALGGRRED